MILRDGYTPSLWQSTVQPYVSNSQPDPAATYDVIIVGGGITGISTGLLLQEAGLRCLVLEARNLCFGTTGGTTAHLNTLLDTPYSTIEKKFSATAAKQVAAASAAAIATVRRNIDKYGIQCGFKEADAYLFAQTKLQQKELADIFEATAKAGVSVSLTDAIPFPFTLVQAMKAGDQAKFHPLDYVHGIATAFEKAGGCILQECRVTALEHSPITTVTTQQGKFKAGHIVYATHIPPGINLLHLRCSPYRSYAMACLLDNQAYPQDLAYDMEDPYNYYRTQTINCVDYLIAGGKDHRTGEEVNTEHLFTELEATVRTNFNVKEVVYRWSSQYFEPADGLPYIGHLPGQPSNVFVATGFGGNGMTYSHVAARVLTDMITGKDNELSSLFSPSRIKPIAGFTEFVAHNAGVAANFAGKLFSAEKLHELVELAPGEGKIVQHEGKKMGLFKDEGGQLHAVNPTCTHMKCEVKWNAAEQSWDCPCHGARYDCDGKVITGPADHSLEQINLAALEEKARSAAS